MTTKYAELCHYFQVQTLILTHSWELRASSFVAIRPFTVYYARAQCGALPALRVKIFLIYRLLTECNGLTSFNKNPNIIWVFHGVACIQDLVLFTRKSLLLAHKSNICWSQSDTHHLRIRRTYVRHQLHRVLFIELHAEENAINSVF